MSDPTTVHTETARDRHSLRSGPGLIIVVVYGVIATHGYDGLVLATAA